MKPVIFTLPGSEPIGTRLATELPADAGSAEIRSFPDEETYVRILTKVEERKVILVCTLDRPDRKVLPLLFLLGAARDQGASEVGLVAPYLAYMRQDRCFKSGEAVTSQHFAHLISANFDWMVTVDPHLHRRSSLQEIYAIPTHVIHAAPLISKWIREQVDKPLLVGPDIESEQWVANAAEDAGAPYTVLEKVRSGDRDVEISVPKVDASPNHTPVLLDDIVSTGRTMIETVKHMKRAGFRDPVCICVHAVFAEGAYEALKAAGASQIVSCDTIPHPSNRIEAITLMADALRNPPTAS